MTPIGCTFVYQRGVHCNCMACGKPLGTEVDTVHENWDGWRARLVCAGCCVQHGMTQPFEDGREAVSIAGKQEVLFGN